MSRRMSPSAGRLVAAAVAAVVLVVWFTVGAGTSWVRPVLLALCAGLLAIWYWRRSSADGRTSDATQATTVDSSTREVWDALDRGEDPTDR
jgi:hypothetical protein